MKKVLLISYVFPPMAAVGGYRTIKYCKFLPQFGWQPSVLTVRHGYNTAYDESLLKQIDSSVPVYRSGNAEPLVWWDKRSTQPSEAAPSSDTKAAEPTRAREHHSIATGLKTFVRKAISLPDQNNFWVPCGVRTGLQAVKREHVDVIYTSSPPNSTHLVGYYLSRLTGKPLVIDFRDLWTQNEGYRLRQLPPSLARIDRRLEQKVIRRAKAMITTTESFSEIMRQCNPSFDPGRVFTITNGIDVDDFRHVPMPSRRNEKFTILHLGSLYGHRNPDFFFDCVRAWVTGRPEIAERTEILFIGNAPGFERAVEEPPLKGLVTMLKHIPQEKVLPKLWEADLLLLILGFDPGGRGVLPAKLFEYLCTGRPILSMVPAEGEAQAALQTYDKGLIATGPDSAKVVQFLNRQFDNWVQSPEQRESMVAIPPQFDRRVQAQKLASVLDKVLE